MNDDGVKLFFCRFIHFFVSQPLTISLTKFDFLSLVVVGRSLILFENQNYPLSTCLDELKFYRRLRFLGYL